MTKKISPKTVFVSLIVILALFAALYLTKQNIFFSPKATTSYQEYQLQKEVPVIEDSSGLDQLVSDLDQIDLDQIDQAIEDNTQDINSLQ